MALPMKNIRKSVTYVATGLAIMSLHTTASAQISGVRNSFFLPANGAAYADIADLVSAAPTIIDLQIRKIRKLPESQTIGVPPSVQRAVVEADVVSLLRGTNAVAGKVRFLLDIPKDARGRIPKLKKRRFFAMGRGVNGRSDMIQLVRPDALVEFSQANNETVRAIASEMARTNAPAAIKGIASAFHNAGTILGEGETQIFLDTVGGQPFGLSIASQPGGNKQWSVSTSEVITQTQPAPQRNTLLWYRLACGLPKQLSPGLVGSGDGAHAARAQADFAFVIRSLGPCGRTRTAPLG